jgi:hypothetical protein
MLRDHVEAPIQDHHHHKLLLPLLHGVEILGKKSKNKKERRERRSQQVER